MELVFCFDSFKEDSSLTDAFDTLYSASNMNST